MIMCRSKTADISNNRPILTRARANNHPNFLFHGPSYFWRSRVMPLTLCIHIFELLSSRVLCLFVNSWRTHVSATLPPPRSDGHTVCRGLDWTGLDWTGLDWTSKTRTGKTGTSKTRTGKTQRNIPLYLKDNSQYIRIIN